MKNESNDNENTPVSGENETPTRFESTIETEERWLPIPGYEGHYEVSDMGRVRKLKSDSQRLLKIYRNKRGYCVVNLYKDGGFKTKSVHRLVLLAFVGPCPGGYEACHYDGVRDNNHITNLRWGSRSENQMDRRRHGTTSSGGPKGARHPMAKLTEQDVLQIRQMFLGKMTQKEIATRFGVEQTNISQIALRKIWRHC